MSKIFLIPTTIGNSDINDVIPLNVQATIKTLRQFFVENIRTARRYLKLIDKSFPIDECMFYEINKHTTLSDISGYFDSLNGDAGIISESGSPAVADPGASIVDIAHRKGWKIIPLVGPSSILLSLMSSGLNGQNFAFIGYLPIDKNARAQKIKFLEQQIKKTKQTQIFIETPYRNQALFESLLQNCQPSTRLCVAKEITTPLEDIITRPIVEWKRTKPNISKQNVIFLLG